MNFKKHITIMLLALINVALLVHVVTPHHYHHDKAVCLTVTDSCKEHHDSKDKCHDHDSQHKHEDIEGCSVNYFLVKQSNPNFNSQSFDLIATIFCQNQKIISVFNAFVFEYKPYIYSYYLSYAGCALGLRAPPTSPFSVSPKGKNCLRS